MAAFLTFGAAAALAGDAAFLAGAARLGAGDLAAFLGLAAGVAAGCSATASTTLVSSAILVSNEEREREFLVGEYSTEV